MCIFVTGSIESQRHVCGTTIQDQQLSEDIFRQSHQDMTTHRGDKIYIPIKFHLVGKSDGKGKASFKSVLNQLDKLNKDFAPHNFVFYLKDGYNFGSIDNSTLYEKPRENENLLKNYKDPKAVNIFIVNNIGNASLNQIVLGYFSPSNDFVVVLKGELEKLSNTLSHEVGHFFNLWHTFYGWEEEPYLEATHGNPCLLNFAPGTNNPVERMNKSNCVTAGDKVCDTPPDYHFDINYASACVFTKIVKDKNNDTIRPMVNNQMSYFTNCDTFKFTQGQEDRMRINHGNALRAYIRSSYVPTTDTLPTICKFVWPQDKDTAFNYTSVDFTWEDQGAKYYLLEIQNSSEYYYYFTNQTAYTVNDLKAKKTYFASVRAFHDGYTGTSTNPTRFFTGDLQSSTNNVDINDNLIVFPNPLENNSKLYFNLKTNEKVNSISVTDAKGTSFRPKFFNVGNGTYSIDIESLKTSMWLLKINTDTSVYTQKIIIK
jgi:hypothetical protein